MPLSHATQIDLEEMVCRTSEGHHTAISVLDPAIYIEKRVYHDGRERFGFRASFTLEIEILGFDREYDELDSYDHRM